MDFKEYLLISENALEDITLPEGELNFSFVRSSGPGGQKVNKTASKAVLSWHVKSSVIWKNNQEALSRFLSGNKISNKGHFRADCQEQRSQGQNKEACINKLKNAIKEALKKPVERLTTAPTTRSVEKRIGKKKERSRRKSERGQKWNY
jgi:ribosome-associated protein